MLTLILFTWIDILDYKGTNEKVSTVFHNWHSLHHHLTFPPRMLKWQQTLRYNTQETLFLWQKIQDVNLRHTRKPNSNPFLEHGFIILGKKKKTKLQARNISIPGGYSVKSQCASNSLHILSTLSALRAFWQHFSSFYLQ